jgi:GNAT superfamily N-acetyltransferase
MGIIEIKQACVNDIPLIESILLDAVNWLIEMGEPLWEEEQVAWKSLSENYAIDDFYIAYMKGGPSGCVVIMDHDPLVWPDIAKGESLFIHKLGVKKAARKTGAADALIDFAKELCKKRGVSPLRLDCHQFRPRLRAFYERHGFTCVAEKVLFDKYDMALYLYIGNF